MTTPVVSASAAGERARPVPGVHRLIERWARETPDADALLCGDRRLSYAELDRWAFRLASRLRRLGVGPDVPVGLHLTRSVELAVAVLAVLKSGGVCVPLDPAYPPERLALALTDSAPPVVLAQRRPAFDATAHPGTVLCLDESAEQDAAPARPPATAGELHPQNLAWIAYTSGSTGTPKGVALAHGPLANLALEIGRGLGLGPGDRVLQFASIGFSVAAEEMLATWAAGACLVVDPDETLGDCARLTAVVDRYGVSVMQLTPAYWYEWLRELDHDGTPRPPASLRLLVVGSERVDVRRAADWLPTGVRLVQEYGATEGTVSQLLYETAVDGTELRTWPRLPIGRPLAGTQVRLLDERLRPVPDGRPGELYLAGDCLARGYLGQPGMTAERFLPDPYARRPGARMYRTGDLARRRDDGALEFLGRADHQIKVHGVRIEPGEVESALGRYPGVAASAVFARMTPAGTDQLCARVVWEDGHHDPAGLRVHLTDTLPRALVPARIVPVAALPLNANGKVDRGALPDLPLADESDPTCGAAPRTALEAAVAGVCAMALDVHRVGLDDDFFELGGDSLTATRIAAGLREALAVDIRQRAVFAAPTVRALAEAVAERRRAHGAEKVADSAAGARDGARGTAGTEPERAPLTSSQLRMWLQHRMTPVNAAYNEPVVLRLQGDLVPEALRHALRQVARRHAALRVTIGNEGGHPVQRIAPPGADDFALAITDLSHDPSPDLDRIINELATAPFDLVRGPLSRADLLRTSATDHVLVLVFHHIVFDGWSIDVLFRNLSELYREALTGEPARLPQLPVSYASHAARNAAGSSVADGQLSYWREALSGAPEETTLPPTRAAPSLSATGVACPFAVDSGVAARLRELATAEHATSYTVLLAGFMAFVHRESGAHDLVVGTLVSGRDRPGTAGMIGLLTNTVALRAHLTERMTFRQLLCQTRETVQGALEHQDVPFDRVVRELRPSRDRQRNPLFQLMFSYGGTTVRAPVLPGLHAEPLRVETGAAKFDATVMLEEDGNGGFTGVLEYDLARYDEATAWRLTASFHSLLALLAVNPDAGLHGDGIPDTGDQSRTTTLEEL
ncbi:non-ribosomal peptide synthetase [Streptomyces coffeae]|uniref:Amino acid adenylation domain-containing protein n=1 Tax=Streptomyces coffeae TaxID=621382 RepID=A0ABS1NGJ6_9ACTN|nr:non-ribosomal peptide synthetase [Streptomyces coffeae]MBL1099173.1 amino acid adenylation domain-containing protein [Streptomyces coffeae]